MTHLLAGVSQYCTDKGCYVQHHLDDDTPYIKIKRHKVKGFIEAQIYDGKLLLLYRREDSQAQLYRLFHAATNTIRRRLTTHHDAKCFELSRPDCLGLAFNYVRKHLFPKDRGLRGGL